MDSPPTHNTHTVAQRQWRLGRGVWFEGRVTLRSLQGVCWRWEEALDSNWWGAREGGRDCGSFTTQGLGSQLRKC